MVSDPISFTLLAIISLIVGIMVWWICLRNQMILIVATLMIFILNIALDLETISLGFGQYNVYLTDILSVLLISVAIGRLFLLSKWRDKRVLIILVLGVLLTVSWLRGTRLFGIENSTNSLRPFLYFYSVLFFMSTVKYFQDFFDQWVKWIGLTGLGLIVIVVIRWIAVWSGSAASEAWVAPNGWMIRVISASATLFLLQLLVYLLFVQKTNRVKFFAFLASMVLFVLVIVLQQRTVWVALIIAVIVTILLKSKLRSVVVLFFLFCIVLTLFFCTWNNLSIENLSGTSLDLQNFNWRIFGWQALLASERFQTPLDYFIGQPFGTGYARYILNSIYETTVSPHNFYIQTFLNIGGFGILSLLLLYGSILKKLWNLRADRLGQMFIVLLSTQLVFYLTYAPSFEQGLIIGLAILYTGQTKRKEINDHPGNSINRS